MKIGVYLPGERPDVGGTSSLIETILKELQEDSVDKKEIVILFKSSPFAKYKEMTDGIEYINMNRFKLNVWLKCMFLGMKYHFKNLGRRLWLRQPNYIRASWMDLLAQKETIDLFWFTEPVLENLSTPYIYTVWDIGYRLLPAYPEMSSSAWNWNLRELTLQTMLPRASYVIVGNETGKKEILENYPIPAAKVRIVPFPVTEQCYVESASPNADLPKRFFFYPAQFWAHKNHIVIIEALQILKDRGITDVGVVFTGADYINQEYIREQAKKRGLLDEVLFLGFVTKNELKYLYTHAVGLVYASLSGPNNLPPMEAAYMGCPVILSNLEGHIEDMNDVAMIFDGYSDTDLADKMISLLEDENMRQIYIRKGKEFIAKRCENSYYSVIKLIFEEFRTDALRWKKI